MQRSVPLKTDLGAVEHRLVHAYDKLRWTVPPDTLQGRFLDIGCGMGAGVIAATKLGASLSVGIDRDFKEFGHNFQVEEFDQVCRHFGGMEENAILIEGDIFEIGFPRGSFDYCMMLDSIEHVPAPEKFIDYAYQMVKPGGYFVLDTSPLYYSPVGHHLWGYFPMEEYPWIHLWSDFAERLRAARIDDWSLQRFQELNKVTHDGVVRAVLETGFEIVLENRGGENERMLALLEKVADRIAPEHLEHKNRLFEEWILIVARRPV